jgi:Kef-type K+ transport system membrane component KefB/CBS domain-containing protein
MTMGSLHLGVLFILGIGVFGGILGGLFFQKLNVPQVIGYIVIGLVIGRSGFRVIDAGTIETFRVFNSFALGIIGFLVGGELFWGTIRRYGRQFSGILLGEGTLAFGMVTAFTSVMLYLLTGKPVQSLAVGLVFGAVSAATDPASTLDVLWEYRGAGVLTTTIVAIVALDDALAMTLYGIGSGISHILMGGGSSLGSELFRVAREIFGAILLGAGGGFILNLVLRYNAAKDRIAAFAIAVALIVISSAQMMRLDIIFASMSMGLVVRNLAPHRSRNLFDLVRNFAVPIYVFFFVLVGARLEISSMPWWMWATAGLYCLGRNGGKIAGAWIGGRLTGAEPAVRRYTGLGLFAQGGVTIGLAIIASQHLSGLYIMEGVALGDTVVFVITATTLILQLSGPPMVKLVLRLSGEAGRNVTREDMINRFTVGQRMSTDVTAIRDHDPVRAVVDVFSSHEHLLYPVVNAENRFLGVITFENLKNVLTDRDVWEWMVAKDLAEDPREVLRSDTSLEDALALMEQVGVEQLPVLDDKARPVGILDTREVIRSIDREILAMKGGQ